MVDSAVTRCVTCIRWQKKPGKGPESPDLPRFRLSCDFAFSSTGVDYAGPLYVKAIYNPGTVIYKTYMLLFTCATTRNIHLELTPDMESESLIRALRRFLSRRGYVKLFISDNFQTLRAKKLLHFYKENV